MPTYAYECACGRSFDRVLPVSRYNEPQTCDCGLSARKVITPTWGYVQRECRYDSPIDGRPITSWRQRADDLARNGCQEYDPGMKQDYHRRMERDDAALEKKLEATVEAQIETMGARKRERLQAELDSGATATPERGLTNIATTRSITP